MKFIALFLLYLGESAFGLDIWTRLRFSSEDDACDDVAVACKTFERAQLCGMIDECASSVWSAPIIEHDQDEEQAQLRGNNGNADFWFLEPEREIEPGIDCKTCIARVTDMDKSVLKRINTTMRTLCPKTEKRGKSCNRTATALIRNVDRFFKSRLRPKSTCIRLGLCKRNVTANDDSRDACDTCRVLFDSAKEGLLAPLFNMQPVCDGHLVSLLIPGCHEMMRDLTSILSDVFQTWLDGETVCTALDICEDTRDASENKDEENNVQVYEERVKQGSCKECMNTVKKFNTSVSAVIHQTEQDICDSIGLQELVKQCRNWSKTYEYFLHKEIIDRYLNSEEVCKNAGACVGGWPYVGGSQQNALVPEACSNLTKACKSREAAEMCGLTRTCIRTIWSWNQEEPDSARMHRMKSTGVWKVLMPFLDARALEPTKTDCYNCKAMVECFNWVFKLSPIVNDTLSDMCKPDDEFCTEWARVYWNIFRYHVRTHNPGQQAVCEAIGVCKKRSDWIGN